MGFKFWQTFPMTLREVLSQNFNKLRKASPTLKNLDQLVSKGAPSRGTLDRITRCEVDLGIDKLEPLAEVFGIEPWQLLHPDFEPGAMDNGLVLSAEEHRRVHSHLAQSIALLVDQVPDSDESTKTQMLIAVSRIAQEWNERQKSNSPSVAGLKKPATSRRVKT
jgi:transcriptional regulator with XRE-family HTH domain